MVATQQSACAKSSAALSRVCCTHLLVSHPCAGIDIEGPRAVDKSLDYEPLPAAVRRIFYLSSEGSAHIEHEVRVAVCCAALCWAHGCAKGSKGHLGDCAGWSNACFALSFSLHYNAMARPHAHSLTPCVDLLLRCAVVLTRALACRWRRRPTPAC